ncbi:MAG TPA: response regulator transcription factor [Terriglobales bacterium]|nr:response regulator transcription factor [Terriglobales bacterium]
MKTPRACQTRIVIASSNLLTSRLLAQVLEKQSDLSVVAVAGDCATLLRALERSKPHLALISVHLQDGAFSGVALTHDLRGRFPDLPWVLLADRPDPALVVDAYRAGARGVFSCAQYDSTMLRKCVHRVLEGQVWADTAQMRCILEALNSPAARTMDKKPEALSLLTAREETVVRLVAQGMGNREIAQQMGVSVHTIKSHLFHIFEKLGFSNRVELVLYAIAKLNQAKFPSIDLPTTSPNLPREAPRAGLFTRLGST